MENELSFKLTSSAETVLLQFSDGNVLVADSDGITAYTANKTVLFKASENQVYPTYIFAKEEDGTEVWIQPLKRKTKHYTYGLQPHKVFRKDKKVVQYLIKDKHFSAFRNFIVKSNLDKFNDADD